MAEVRTCRKCGEDREHGPNRAKPDGLQVYCRQCQRDAGRRSATTEAMARWGKDYRARTRTAVLAAYGAACACCGENQEKFLTLDHIHGVPDHHRHANGRRLPSDKIYARVVREGFPADYQILCFNCNCAKGFFGACPHEEVRQEVLDGAA